MDTTAKSFAITLSDIGSAAQQLGMLASARGFIYVHNGAGHPPYVYVVDANGATDHAATRDASEFLPVFTHKFTRRESMAALEACERALSHVARFQAARPWGDGTGFTGTPVND